MTVMVDAVDWVTAERFCELTGELPTNLKNLRPLWDEGLVWVQLSERKFSYSIKGYNKWVMQKAQSYRAAQEQKMEKSRLTLHGTANGSGSSFHSRTPILTSPRQLRLDKS